MNLLSFISEPGYYEDGSFGVRVENVMEVKKVNLKVINGLEVLVVYSYPSTLKERRLNFKFIKNIYSR